MRSKTIALFLATITASSLVACQNQPAENTAPTPGSGTTTPGSETTTPGSTTGGEGDEAGPSGTTTPGSTTTPSDTAPKN